MPTYGTLDVAGLVRLAIDHDDEHLASLAPAPTSASAPTSDSAPPDPT